MLNAEKAYDEPHGTSQHRRQQGKFPLVDRCDIRPAMTTDEFLREHIKTIDCFFCDDVQDFMGK
jgi:hypothetical protein